MGRLQEPPNPWGLLTTFPGWRSLRETLHDLEQLLRAAGPDAADLTAGVAGLLADPVSARADLPADYRLHLSLQKRRLTEQVDLENDLPGWLSDIARMVCDAPVLLAAGASADGLGPALTLELPRAWQARFADLVQQLRQMLQGRKLRGGASGEVLEAWELSPGLRHAVPQPDGFAVVLPAGAVPAVAGPEVALLLLGQRGLDAARLHLRLEAGPASHEDVRTALGLRRPDPERCYRALRALQGIRLSVYAWELREGALSLEHQARDLWSLRVQEGGQARLIEEGGTLVTRGQEWWVTPDPQGWAARDSALAHSLLVEREGAKNPLSLAIGLCLAAGQTRLTNREILHLAGLDPAEPQPELWPRVRAALRLQQRAGWVADLSGWGKRSDLDWVAFLETTTSLLPG